MKSVNATTRLKDAILVKESQQAALKKLLKEDFEQLKESLKPGNLIRSSVNKMVGSPGSLLDTSLGLTAGFLSKKLVNVVSHNPLIRLAGTFLQFGVSTMVMNNPEMIKSIGGRIFKSIFRKSERHPEPEPEQST